MTMMKPDTVFACATAPKRDSRHWKNETVTWQTILDWMAMPDTVKECGNYLLGTLRKTTVKHPKSESTCANLHRNKESVVTRGALTLDLDSPVAGLPEVLELTLDHAAVLHTTYQSTPTAPRYRLIIPLDREIAPDEYLAAATYVMNLLGTENFDPSTGEPERYMFKPAAEELDNFQWWQYDGGPACADDLLADFTSDLSGMPLPNSARANKRDPFQIDGVIGAFNRAYADIQLLITEYDLPYTPAGSGRWHLLGSKAVAGMGEVSDGIVWSHHANDPAYGQACTAFDLVRLHKFSELDDGISGPLPVNRRPSHDAMMDLAMVDPRVTAELVGVDFASAMDDTISEDSWKLGLSTNRNGKLQDSVLNWDLICANDKVMHGLRYNEMTLAIETEKDLPWRPLHKGGSAFTNKDRASLQAYLEREYRTMPTRMRVDWMVDETAMRRYMNPVRNWLSELEWDGVERLETCLPGVAITSYTRLVARKVFVAAVARMMQPGCKWDHTLIIKGPEGLGKTHWIERMAKGWTAPLGKVDNKDTLIAMQRCWIVTNDENSSMKKADAEALKEFITRREDVFRLPFEREAQVHPRHCVIWGTTNDDVFLRRQEGNRRFLIVTSTKKVDFTTITDHYVDQVWAEAMHLYRLGEELLWLSQEESNMAAVERETFVEEGDGYVGLIHEYVNTAVPDDWDDRSHVSRQNWLRDRADGFEPPGTWYPLRICSLQIWVEVLNRVAGQHSKVDLLEIGKALRELGWTQLRGKHVLPLYGPQVAFERPDGTCPGPFHPPTRKDSAEDDFSDLI